MDEFRAKLLEMLKKALNKFFDKELDNLLNGTAERNLCSRLSIYLEELLVENNLEKYYADSEYNRQQNGQVKTMLKEELVPVTINCDIIVHSRGNEIENDNLIAIEMKKSGRPKDEKDSDRLRLKTLTKESYDSVWSNDGTTHPEYVCGYKLGIYIEIDKDNRKSLCEGYIKGEKALEWSKEF